MVELYEVHGRETEEGVDREKIYAVAKDLPNVIAFQDSSQTWTREDKRRLVIELDVLKRDLPCFNVCLWILWYIHVQDQIYIQHGFNIEHVTKLSYHHITLKGLGEEIKAWIMRVHEHLDKVKDDS